MSDVNSSKVKVAVYLRRSTTKQEDSLDRQWTQVAPYCQRKNYEVVERYEDDGISGDEFVKRHAFMRLLADARTGKFAVIVADDVSRVSRQNPLHFFATVAYPLDAGGVVIDSVAHGLRSWDDIAGLVLATVEQYKASKDQSKLSRDVLTAGLRLAKEGRHVGGKAPYGYRVEYVQRGPRRIPIRLVVEEKEARIVRWMFERYANATVSMKDLVDDLTARGVEPPEPSKRRKVGKKWKRQTILCILRNERYTGAAVWGKIPKGKFHRQSGGEVVKLPPGERTKPDYLDRDTWVVVPKSHDEIVSRELFDKVQLKLSRNSDGRAASARGGYMLSGLLRCGNCGRTMVGFKKANLPYYRCHRMNDDCEVVCASWSIKQDVILSAIVKHLRDTFLNPERLAELREELRRMEDVERSAEAVAQLKRELADVEAKIAKATGNLALLDADMIGPVQKQIREWKSERGGLVLEIDRLAGISDREQLELMIESIENLLWELEDLVTADAPDPGLVRELIDSMVDKVEVRFKVRMAKKGTKRSFYDPDGGTIYLSRFCSPDKSPQSDLYRQRRGSQEDLDQDHRGHQVDGRLAQGPRRARRRERGD